MTRIHQLIPMADINTPGIRDWLSTNVIPLIVMVVAIAILVTARQKGRTSENMERVFTLTLGVVIFAAAGSWFLFGDSLRSIIIRD